jgi:hypothetical protein
MREDTLKFATLTVRKLWVDKYPNSILVYNGKPYTLANLDTLIATLSKPITPLMAGAAYTGALASSSLLTITTYNGMLLSIYQQLGTATNVPAGTVGGTLAKNTQTGGTTQTPAPVNLPDLSNIKNLTPEEIKAMIEFYLTQKEAVDASNAAAGKSGGAAAGGLDTSYFTDRITALKAELAAKEAASSKTKKTILWIGGGVLAAGVLGLGLWAILKKKKTT